MKAYLSIIKSPIIYIIILRVVLALLPYPFMMSIAAAFDAILASGLIFWAGWLMVSKGNRNILEAAYSGPIVFFFSFVISLVQRWIMIPPEMDVPEGLFFGRPYIAQLYISVMGYCTLFPVVMGIAALGAFFSKRKLAKQLLPTN